MPVHTHISPHVTRSRMVWPFELNNSLQSLNNRAVLFSFRVIGK